MERPGELNLTRYEGPGSRRSTSMHEYQSVYPILGVMLLAPCSLLIARCSLLTHLLKAAHGVQVPSTTHNIGEISLLRMQRSVFGPVRSSLQPTSGTKCSGVRIAGVGVRSTSRVISNALQAISYFSHIAGQRLLGAAVRGAECRVQIRPI